MRLFVTKEMFDGNDILNDIAFEEKDGVIVWMGKVEEHPHECDEIIDLTHYFVMPGLIDCHVHISSTSGEQEPETMADAAHITVRAIQNLKGLLSAGVVACRDLGSIGGVAVGIQKAIDDKVITDVPMVLTCGKSLCATGGHGHEISIECDGPNEFVKGTRQVIKDGAKIVKLMVSGGVNSPGTEPGPPELKPEEIKAAVDEAHMRGRRVSAHCHGYTAIKHCVEQGVDSIEHGVFMEDDLIELMKEKGTYLVPTLSAPYWATKEGLRLEPDNPDHKKSNAIIQRHFKVVRDCFDQNVNIAMGTDAGCPFNPYELAYNELVLLVEAGIKPLDALKIATKNGAELLQLDNLGVLAVGKQATFLAVDGSPLLHIRSMGKIKNICLRGSFIREGGV
ncbi:MAG: amidohydrolase family protein [Sphaerochaetaceae bacterium]|nr:amidohydrolase family protein [Sphaerochaetaceae bacterium]